MLILCLFKFMNMNNLQSGLLFSLTGITACHSSSSSGQYGHRSLYTRCCKVSAPQFSFVKRMMSCYDKRYMETPNLDRIANDGVRFTNSFVANSLSGPSRACMITGKHSCANKFYEIPLVYLMVRNRLFRSCCNRPDTRPPLSENGT